MRCYLMRKGHIGDVEVLTDESDDAAIRQADALFETRNAEEFEGFEIWDRARFVHRHPPAPPKYRSPGLPTAGKSNEQGAKAAEMVVSAVRSTRDEARTLLPRRDSQSPQSGGRQVGEARTKLGAQDLAHSEGKLS